MPHFTQCQFAKHASVSQQAVSKAIKSGLIFCKDGKIDTDHPINQSYVKSHGKTEGGKKAATGKQKKESSRPKLNIQGISRAAPRKTKTEADIDRLEVVIAQGKVKLAREIETLVLRSSVDKLFGKLYSLVINYFHPMGDRLAPMVAGACGINKPEIVLKVKGIIDEEIMRALEEVKKAAAKTV